MQLLGGAAEQPPECGDLRALGVEGADGDGELAGEALQPVELLVGDAGSNTLFKSM